MLKQIKNKIIWYLFDYSDIWPKWEQPKNIFNHTRGMTNEQRIESQKRQYLSAFEEILYFDKVFADLELDQDDKQILMTQMLTSHLERIEKIKREYNVEI